MEIKYYLWIHIFIHLYGGIFAGSGYDFSTLLRKYTYNQYLFDNVPRPFEIVYPKRVYRNDLIGISTKEHKLLGIYEHLPSVTFQFAIAGRLHKIRLKRNDVLLSDKIQVKHFKDQNQQIITQTVEHCFYHGNVKRDDWSSVAVSTCHGIRGVIHFNNETYVILPLIGGDEGMEHPHVIFKATPSKTQTCGNEVGQWMSYEKLHKGEFVQRVKLLKAQQLRQQVKDDGEKRLKLALVLDSTMYSSLNLSQSEIVNYTVQMVNVVDLYFKVLKIRVQLSYLEMWNTGNRMPVSPGLRELLGNFLKYKNQHMNGISFHSAQFITGEELDTGSVGMAIPDSICTDRAVGINKNPSILQPQQLSTVLSHMIGHNLGIKHDEETDRRLLYHRDGCVCEDEYGCIMSTRVLAGTGLHSRQFSSCSLSDLDVSLTMDVPSCLANGQEQTFAQRCGNLHIERGEECDCGTPEECQRTDPCCDPSTCLLKSWAQCRSGACCHNCTFLSSDHVCREKSTECDVPEFCPGNSGECPTNNYVADGHPCSNNTGYCLGGICPTLQQQCQFIWGDDATGADLQCFETFNPTGNFNGHCGKDDKTGFYAKCLPENIQCGLLHCQGGSNLPMFGSDRKFSKTTTFNNGIQYECNVIHGPAVMVLPHFGLVQDGTKCGTDKVCLNKQCVPISRLPPLTCPGTQGDFICYGHGMCTKQGTCFCEEGWADTDCTRKVNITKKAVKISKTTTTMISSTRKTTTEAIKVVPVENVLMTTRSTESPVAAVVLAEGEGLSTVWLIIILVSVVGGLVFVLTFTFLCYRRKTPVKFSSTKKGFFGLRKKSVKNDNCSESENKIIKFGTLPSYKTDKLFWKKKKKGMTSEEESDIGELPPPPIIISNPDSAKPERGILKNFHKYSSDERRSSESHTERSDTTCDQESVEPYMYNEDDDDEADEIQEILSHKFEPEQSMEALDQIAESSSFDFVLPNPNFCSTSSNHSVSPPRRTVVYDFPLNSNPPTRPFLWKTNPNLSPPKSKIIRMKNLDELIQQIDRHTIDLSPSPDELQLQLSPSTSEDVRSSSTEDRPYQNGHTPQSPQSITSGSTRDTYRPFLGSQWTKYMLKRNELDTDGSLDLYDVESPVPNINIPPPMSPLNLRSIYNYAQTSLARDNNDTPLGSQTGEVCSNNGTANSRCGYEKSSGYGSEHDPERFSIEDVSQTHSRSGSISPPSFSAVIRTGPNQIKLVSAKTLHDTGLDDHHDLEKLLQELPRIDAGSFERNPVHMDRMHDKDKNYLDQNSFECAPVGPLPNGCPLAQQNAENSGSAPCIDCSLESIPQATAKTRASRDSVKGKKSNGIINYSHCNGSAKDLNCPESKRHSVTECVALATV